MTIITRWTLCPALMMLTGAAMADCRDAVVLVHGNTGSPSDWDNTVVELLARGWQADEIFLPDWGSKTCAACNDHNGGEEAPVVDAMVDALAVSCTDRVDVIGHSMGATLAAKQIADYQLATQVDAFIGVAGAFRGLWTCGTYPWNVWTSTCGPWGLSVNNPFLNSLSGRHFGQRVHSIKSWNDQVVCATGVCTVGGIHSSRIPNEDQTWTFVLGHFGLQSQTAAFQVDLLE